MDGNDERNDNNGKAQIPEYRTTKDEGMSVAQCLQLSARLRITHGSRRGERNGG
jgi:hypothetical protein